MFLFHTPSMIELLQKDDKLLADIVTKTSLVYSMVKSKSDYFCKPNRIDWMICRPFDTAKAYHDSLEKNKTLIIEIEELIKTEKRIFDDEKYLHAIFQEPISMNEAISKLEDLKSFVIREQKLLKFLCEVNVRDEKVIKDIVSYVYKEAEILKIESGVILRLKETVEGLEKSIKNKQMQMPVLNKGEYFHSSNHNFRNGDTIKPSKPRLNIQSGVIHIAEILIEAARIKRFKSYPSRIGAIYMFSNLKSAMRWNGDGLRFKVYVVQPLEKWAMFTTQMKEYDYISDQTSYTIYGYDNDLKKHTLMWLYFVLGYYLSDYAQRGAFIQSLNRFDSLNQISAGLSSELLNMIHDENSLRQKFLSYAPAGMGGDKHLQEFISRIESLDPKRYWSQGTSDADPEDYLETITNGTVKVIGELASKEEIDKIA